MAPKVINRTKPGKATGRVKVWGVGVSYLKMQLYGWLLLTIPVEGDSAGIIPQGFCHFLPQESYYFRGITAEELVPVRSKKTNAITYEWVKRYVRNEPLDCRIYATAAAYIIGFDRWDEKRWKREAGMIEDKPKAKAKNATVEEADKKEIDAPKDNKPESKKKKRSKGGFWGDW